MPAIQPERLKAQIAQLGQDFSQPSRYIGRLHDLFDYYADRTRRPGQAGSRVPLLRHYNIPAPVLRELQRNLASHITDLPPEEALSLIDAFWADGFFETHLLAGFLLSHCNASPADIVERLWEWIQPQDDVQVVDALLENGYAALNRSQPGAWMNLVTRWLGSDRPGTQSIGIQAVSLLIRDPAFENFPPIFTLLTPVVHSAPVALHTELTNILQQLATRTPSETAFFLRQALAISPNRSITRLVRRCLPFFDSVLQQPLREALTVRLGME
jgi:hypothetical protein